MALPSLKQLWTSKPPEKLEDIAAFIGREGLPIWRQMRDLLNQIVDVLNLGSPVVTDFIQNVGSGTSGHFTIGGAGFTPGKDVLIVQTAQPIPSKGNARDELEMDAIILTGYVVDAATIQVYWRATGIVVGDYAFAYQIAA